MENASNSFHFNGPDNGLALQIVSARKKSSSFTFLYPQGSFTSPREWSPRGPSLIAVQEYDNEAKAPNDNRGFLFANRSPVRTIHQSPRSKIHNQPAHLQLPSLGSVHAQKPDGLSYPREGSDHQNLSDTSGSARAEESEGL